MKNSDCPFRRRSQVVDAPGSRFNITGVKSSDSFAFEARGELIGSAVDGVFHQIVAYSIMVSLLNVGLKFISLWWTLGTSCLIATINEK